MSKVLMHYIGLHILLNNEYIFRVPQLFWTTVPCGLWNMLLHFSLPIYAVTIYEILSNCCQLWDNHIIGMYYVYWLVYNLAGMVEYFICNENSLTASELIWFRVGPLSVIYTHTWKKQIFFVCMHFFAFPMALGFFQSVLSAPVNNNIYVLLWNRPYANFCQYQTFCFK